jgi:HD-like signal output (HDOD) protein
MFANQTSSKTRLTLATQQSLGEDPESSPFPLPGEAEFSSPPALPDALLRLELGLSEVVTDLQDITSILRGDIGLTVQLLRLAARETAESSERIATVGEMVTHVGVEKLAALAARTKALPHHLGLSKLSLCERFWMHSRLTALIAEELAGQSTDVRPQDAYLAGLLCHLGDLPALLGWPAADSDAVGSCYMGYRIASAWGFPRPLADVIGGRREVCLTHASRAMLDIVMAADTWAYRLEFLALRESERLATGIHSVD